MNTVLLIWNGILTLCVIVLFATITQLEHPAPVPVTHEAGQKPNKQKANTKSTQAAPLALPTKGTGGTGRPSVYFVNEDTLLAQYKAYNTQIKGLEARTRRIQNELIARRNALQTEVATAQQRMQEGKMTQAQAQEAEASFMRKQQDFQAYEQDQSAKLVDEQKKILENLQKNVRDYLKTYASNSGIDFILSYSETSSILYAKDSLEITNQVIEALNAPAPAKKK
jgi:outer membrane protein